MLALLFAFLLALLSLLGGAALWLSEERFSRIIQPLVALAAGALLGGALFHLLPEMIEELGSGSGTFLLLALAFLLFFVLEQFLHWHHCHKSPLKHEPVGYMLLLAGGIHALLDGLVLGAAFILSPELGMITALLISGHEIPQSLGDFGALVSSGWKPRRALLWNFLSALPLVLGAGLSLLLSEKIDPALFLPLAAGGFLYIAAADLLPRMRSETTRAQLEDLFLVLLGAGSLFLLSLAG